MQFRKALIALGIGTLTAVGLALPAAAASATGPASATSPASATEPRPCDSRDHRTDKKCPPTKATERPKHKRTHKPKPRPSKTTKAPKPKPTKTTKKPTKPIEVPTTTAPAQLPTTGDAVSLPLIAGVGAGLVIAGGVLVGMRRRRDATEQ
jgi:LPXTG-motif cell wall-anchored protein